jgi:hypothetical protein
MTLEQQRSHYTALAMRAKAERRRKRLTELTAKNRDVTTRLIRKELRSAA